MKNLTFLTGSDASGWSLITANLLTIAFAVKFGWSPLELMWIYWTQSSIIGIINFIKMRQLESSSASGGGLIGLKSSFFLMHYGFFHLIYFLFMLAFTLAPDTPLKGESPIQWSGVFITAAIFILNHSFSYFYNWERDRPKTNVDRLFIFPYARIIPMHLTLILGAAAGEIFPGIAQAPLLFFLILKTLADVAMHKIEHA